MRNKNLTILAALLIAGCSSTPYYQSEEQYRADYNKAVGGDSRVENAVPQDSMDRVTDQDRAAGLVYKQLTEKARREAYEQGVTDVLEDFRGKQQANGFVWEPPVVEYVEIPAGVRNGAFVPTHKEPVVVSPGRWVEGSTVSSNGESK